ncbi:MAG: fibronectin-binding domain-containing protein [Acholeplasmataceae bacterium]|nr:fibronectin-binding domain-containing protein [Acholeplasmataceae bacterium]
MPIDGYFIERQIEEFLPQLKLGKTRKISGLDKHTILFEIYRKGQVLNLIYNFSPNAAHMRITNNLKGSFNSSFITLLKKELLNTTLKGIKQYKKDRIVFFEFEKSDPFFGKIKRILVFELMGRNSNLILLDEENIILDAANKRFNEHLRSILPKLPYEVFPTTKKEFKFTDLTNYHSSDELFYNSLGFSRELAAFVYNKRVNLTNEPTKPTLYVNQKNIFHAIDLKLPGKKKEFPSTSLLLEYYYSITLKSDDYLIKLLTKEHHKQTTKLTKLSEQLKANKNYDFYRLTADKIYSSSLNLDSRHSEFEGLKLDYNLTLNQNAQALYKRYRKMKNSLEHLTGQIKKTKNLINYYSDLIANFSFYNNDDLTDIKQELINLGVIKHSKKTSKSPTKYLSFQLEGGVCLVGKTAKQNEYLLSVLARGNDLWFHVKDYPGAHVILKGEKSEQNIMFAAKKALEYSSLATLLKGNVNYTLVRNVKRIKDRPGFYVSYKNEQTIYLSI